VLDGKAGNDAMAGGAGNDTYVVDAAGDTIAENVNEGTDLVQSTITWTLAAKRREPHADRHVRGQRHRQRVGEHDRRQCGRERPGRRRGSDALRGGNGNDTYVVDATTDAVTENANEGTDLVNASVTGRSGRTSRTDAHRDRRDQRHWKHARQRDRRQHPPPTR
jgi:hypothetical protein